MDPKRVNEFGTSGEDHAKPPTPTGAQILPPQDEGAEQESGDTAALRNGNDTVKPIADKKND